MRFVRLLGLAVGLTLPSTAVAQTNTARLEVTAAGPRASCADAERLRVAVEQRLGRTVFDAQATLNVRVNFQRRRPSGWTAHIVLEDASGRRLGERELVTNAARCDDLDSSLALVTALLVDAPPEPPPEPTSDEPIQPAEPEPKPTRLLEPETPPQSTPPGEPWRFMVALNALGSWGRTPDLTAGARFDLDVRPPHLLWLKLEARLDLPKRVEDDQTGAGAEVRHASVALAACPWVSASSPALWLCAGQELGLTQARGLDLDENEERSRIGLVIFARAGLAVQAMGPLWLRVGLTGGVPLVRDRYIFSGSDRQTYELFRTQAAIATGELGLAAALP